MNASHQTEDADNEKVRFTLYLHKKKHAKIYAFMQTLPDGSVANYLRDLVLEDMIRRETTLSRPLDLTPAPARRSRRTPKPKNVQSTQKSVGEYQNPAQSSVSHSVTVTPPVPHALAPEPASTTMYTAASAAQPFESAATDAPATTSNVEPEDISEFIDELIAKF